MIVGASDAVTAVAVVLPLPIAGTSEMRTDFLRFAVGLSVAGASAGWADSGAEGGGTVVVACASFVPA